MMDKKSIGIFIPTYNAESAIENVLKKIVNTGYKIFVVDSSSEDRTTEILNNYNISYEVISQPEFNHGSIRDYGRIKLDTDIVVMLTQDIDPVTDDFIEVLVKPILENKAAVAYGRQMPRENANIFESFPREFNYPIESNTRGIEDISKYGVYTFFCSDSFAAYDNRVLEQIGGFAPTLTWEDYFAAAKILMAGQKIAYVSNAAVIHSHDYTLKQEFQRYFDAGYVRAENDWIDKLTANAEARGIEYTKLLFRRVLKENAFQLPYAFICTGVKWIGYRMGYFSLKMPLFIKRKLSGQNYYWDSIYYAENA